MRLAADRLAALHRNDVIESDENVMVPTSAVVIGHTLPTFADSVPRPREAIRG